MLSRVPQKCIKNFFYVIATYREERKSLSGVGNRLEREKAAFLASQALVKEPGTGRTMDSF